MGIKCSGRFGAYATMLKYPDVLQVMQCSFCGDEHMVGTDLAHLMYIWLKNSFSDGWMKFSRCLRAAVGDVHRLVYTVVR